MSSLLVIQENNIFKTELESVFGELTGWNIHSTSSQDFSFEHVSDLITELEIHFLVFSVTLGEDSSNDLAKIHKHHPLLSIILYNSQLWNGEYSDLYKAGINHCIVGKLRQTNLLTTLTTLWNNHWKRLPTSLISQFSDLKDKRVKEILIFIENSPIRSLNLSNIAGHLHISESHFRSEFKLHFNLSFREFKQKLLLHYETVLLFDKKLKPGEIYSLLNYKNISAFSRSFKIRHGSSWQNLIRQRDTQPD